MRHVWVLLSVLASLLSRVARADAWFDDQQQALPCRPTIACTADLAAPGSLEIETGYLFERLHPPNVQHSIPFLTKLTLADWVQLQFGGNGPTFLAPTGVHFFDEVVVGTVGIVGVGVVVDVVGSVVGVVFGLVVGLLVGVVDGLLVGVVDGWLVEVFVGW